MVSLYQMLGGYADFLYQTGMVDELQRQYVKQQTDAGVKLIQQEKWIEAFEVCLLSIERLCFLISLSCAESVVN